MASEIRVDKINSLSGVGTVTLSPTGVDISGITTVQTLKVGSGATVSQDGDIFFTGVCTATTFNGSGANLTNLPAANVTGTLPAISGANLTSLTAGNLTGALPAISGANLTGIAATDNVRTGILDVAGIATFRSDVNIPNINGGQIGGRRNLVINGAMNVAQRGTSSTSGGYLIDQVAGEFTSLDESPTYAQVDVSSGTTPYTLGFRKALKITNGNQTSGAQAGVRYQLFIKLEGQDIANSGWNYTSSTSFVTLSFWVKSSVAQNFYGYLRTKDGTGQRYAFETGSLTADTWTKVTKTIPGNSNIQFDNDNGEGLQINLNQYFGSTYTDSPLTLDAWAAYTSGTRTPNYTSTWYTTNDSTIEYTGLQLEVGSTATAFEHRSIGEELSLCQRYYFVMQANASSYLPTVGSNAQSRIVRSFPVTMRAAPSGSMSNYTLSTKVDGVTGYQSSASTDVLYEGTFSAEL